VAQRQRQGWQRQGFLVSVTWVRASACTPVIPAVFYLPTGLAGCSVGPGISCGARKLTRTPRVTKKKKKKSSCTANFILQTISSNYEGDGVYLIAWQDPNHVKEYSFWIQNNQIIQWRANLLTICPCM
jgi:hypothetical protein